MPEPQAQPLADSNAFPQGSPQPQGSEMAGAPTPAPVFQPMLDDPEIMDMVGEQVDKIRTENAYHAAVALQPTLAPPVRWVPVHVPALSPEMAYSLAGQGGTETLAYNCPVYEGETDAQAYENCKARQNERGTYMAARAASQATFGVTSKGIPYLWGGTQDIERDFESRYSPQETGNMERLAFAVNLAAWPMTPAGWATNKVFGVTTSFVTKTLQRSGIAAKMVQWRPDVPVRKWLSTAFGRTTNEATGPLASTLTRLETAVANAGGRFLADGKLYIPKEVRTASGKAWQEIQEAVGQLKQVLGQKTGVKVVTDPTKMTPLGWAGTAGTGAAGGAAAGGFYRGTETGVTWMLGKTPEERQQAAGDFFKNTGEGAVWGGALGAPFSVGAAALQRFKERGTTIRGTIPPANRQITSGSLVKR